jgi:hypothetical protein
MAEMNKVTKKFGFKAGLSATETLVLVQKAYGNETLNRSNVFRWNSRFRTGWDLVEDDERGGRPKSTRTEVNFAAAAAAAADFVKNDRRITLRMIAKSLNIPKTVVLRILKEDLGKRKMCAHFVPHSLTPEQREDESHLAKTLSRWPMQTIFFNRIITGDETWCLPMTPKQSDRVLNGLVRLPLGRRN